jgi:hypothetical protein
MFFMGQKPGALFNGGLSVALMKGSQIFVGHFTQSGCLLAGIRFLHKVVQALRHCLPDEHGGFSHRSSRPQQVLPELTFLIAATAGADKSLFISCPQPGHFGGGGLKNP